MGESDTKSELAARLTAARDRRDHLLQSLTAMNGGNPNPYSAMGRNEGYDSLLCALRGEQALIEELSRAVDTKARS